MAVLIADAGAANINVDVPIVQLEDWSKGKKGEVDISSAINVRSKSTIYRELAGVDAIEVGSDSMLINPKHMRLNLFYPAELKGERYLFRKISEHEVEVYGFAK